jgi:hypothetical protein
MSVDVDELEIEWDNHFALPVANAENKLLEEAIVKKELDRNRYKNEFDLNQNRANSLKDHIRNVKEELVQTQVKQVASLI